MGTFVWAGGRFSYWYGQYGQNCPYAWIFGLLGLMDNCSVPPSSNWKKLEHELEQPFKRQSGKGLWQPTTSKECSGGQGFQVGTGVGTHI